MSTLTDTTASGDLYQFVPWAAELGSQFTQHRARHDRDGTFVDEAFAILRESGYLALAVPTRFTLS